MWRVEPKWEVGLGDKMKGISERYYSIRKEKRNQEGFVSE
jgi:hypothetical protein